MARLRIHGVARTRAFRVLWMAKELKLDYEHILTETGRAGARKAEFLVVNPNGRLPAIDDDGFVLWESLAINLYLAKKHSPGRLYPASLQGEAEAWKWSLWAANEIEKAVNVRSLHAVRLPPDERDPKMLAAALELLRAPFGVLDGALARQPYLLGAEFTVADLNVAAVASRAHDMDLSATPRLADWLTRCLTRTDAIAARQMRDESEAKSTIDAIRLAARNNRL